MDAKGDPVRHLLRRMISRRLLVSCVLAGTASVWAGGNPATHEEIPLRPYIGPLKSVSVTVEGSALPFILDTGGGFTMLTPDVAKSIGRVPFGRLTGFRHSGERIDTQRCGNVTVRLGSVDISSEVAVFDLMAVLKQYGDLPVVGGLLSLNSFEKTPVTLDYAAQKLVIESPSTLKRRVKDMKPLSIRLSRQAGGAALDVFVEVAAKVGNVWLELDSGNNGPMMLSKHAMEQLGLDPGQKAQPVTLDVIGLGPFRSEAAAADLIYDGLLNVDFFNDAVVTLDLASGKAWAKQRKKQESK
jgi:hypothetical protein